MTNEKRESKCESWRQDSDAGCIYRCELKAGHPPPHRHACEFESGMTATLIWEDEPDEFMCCGLKFTKCEDARYRSGPLVLQRARGRWYASLFEHHDTSKEAAVASLLTECDEVSAMAYKAQKQSERGQ